ncbi:olfactory receptor 13C4-like [Mantella aurantiaca]
MELWNQTFLKELVLVGYSQNRQICALFFLVLLLMYIFTIFGNISLIIAILVSPKLHLPMYFFLCNLSFIDLGYSSICIPKMFVDIFSARRTISITACMVQMNIGFFLGSTESLLLVVMAYDRFVAISFPLYYNIIMNWKVCRTIVIILWPGNFLISVVPIISRPLMFCTENKLDHFVCEILAVVELACGNLTFFKAALFVESLFILVIPLVIIMVSYILILYSILKIRSAEGRSKAFSTCASHLTVVSMFYGTTIAMYVGQNKFFYSNLKYISIVYGMITPVLNPFIYSLRNNDVKESFQKLFVRVVH